MQFLQWPQAAYSRVGEAAYSGCTRRQPTSPQREPRSPIAALSLVKVTLGGSICLSLVLLSQLDQKVGADAGALFISSSWRASLVMYLKTWPMLHGRFCSDAFGGKQTARLKVARTIRGLFSHVGRILQADLFASLLVLDSFPSTNGGLALGRFSHHDVFYYGGKDGRN